MAGYSPQTKLIMDERKRMDFDVEEITHVLDGGDKETTIRRQIVRRIQSDPVMGDLDFSYKTGEEIYINSMKRRLHLWKMLKDYDRDDETVIRAVIFGTMKEWGLGIHDVAFKPTLKNLGSQEQVEKWLPLAKNFGIIGAYAQTELGHGTNLRGLETTATFVPETQEFIINSPNLTSMKWWPGDLGKAANHAIVMADLVIKGQRYGMQPFMVQIRDLDTHMPLPGIKVGNIGEKFAAVAWDNGFLIMDNIRIPRENMLARVAEVDPDGNYNLKSDPRILYGGMMLLRVSLLISMAIVPLQTACTIATRYSIVRTQGSIKPKHLVKCAAAAADGKPVKGSTSYLNDTPTKICPANSTQAMSHHKNLLQAFKHRANFVVRTTQQKIQSLQRSGYNKYDAWNLTSVELVEMAKAHLDFYVLSTFLDSLRDITASAKSKEKLANLCSLWALHTVNENIGDFLKDGYFDSKQAEIAMEAELALLSVVRKDALGLVDAFDFTDKTLRSCLGAYDGNVYERLYENAKRSPRNKTEVHEGFYELLRPYLHKGRDALQITKSKL